jgi:dolichyl-phosphate beta-glucosyltransferase
LYQTAWSSHSAYENVPSLTVLIPAYNEEFRITETLNSYARYFSNSSRWLNRTSIVVVDDGSSDDTARVVNARTTDIPTICVSLPTNQGKGAALAYGIQYVLQQNQEKLLPPRIILTADADGSARVDDLEAFFRVMEEELASNSTIDDKAYIQPLLINGFRTYDSPSALRLFFRWGFRSVVRTVCGDLNVQDTQCGFKLMTLPAAQLLYTNLHLPGWSHDVEVLYRAQQRGIRVREVSVLWEDKDGSKLVSSPGGVLVVCGKMFGEVVKLRFNYAMGKWKV